MPHPLVNEMKIKVGCALLFGECAQIDADNCEVCLRRTQQIQTRPGSRAADDREYTPQRALVESINDLQTELATLQRAFEAEAQRVTGLSRGY